MFIGDKPEEMSQELRILDRSFWIDDITRGDKLLESKNHLGNVLTVISDKKLGFEPNTVDGIADGDKAQVLSANDYYPFGWNMPGRQVSNSDYRFGFNGMENEDELGKGVKNTHYRKLDSRIGRWTSVDPAAAMYYSWSPYNLSMNSPLANSDPSGATVDPGSQAEYDDVVQGLSLIHI